MQQQHGTLGLARRHLECQIPVRHATACVGETAGEVSVDGAALILRHLRIHLGVELCHQLRFERAIVVERLEVRRIGSAELGREWRHMPGHQCRTVGEVNTNTYGKREQHPDRAVDGEVNELAQEGSHCGCEYLCCDNSAP